MLVVIGVQEMFGWDNATTIGNAEGKIVGVIEKTENNIGLARKQDPSVEMEMSLVY